MGDSKIKSFSLELQTLFHIPENRSDNLAEDQNEPSTTGNTGEDLGFGLSRCPHEFSQGCCKHSAAVARMLGSNANIGVRKFANASASTRFQSYFSVRTSSKPHGFSLVMCLSSPAINMKNIQPQSNYCTQ
jgi:hypothetical protein